jgi:flagellar hook-associated protein 1 FlgK
MAISSFLGLQTSLRGLLAQQQALDVTTHNVANANTVGYTRQEATLGAASALHVTGGATQDGSGVFIGQGVDVTAYRRIRDSFLDLQVRAQTMALGEGSTNAQALDNVQSAVNEPSTTGINAMLSKFYAAWTNLSNHPEDPGAKTAVNEAAKTLTDSFAGLVSQISSAAAAAQDQLDATTGANGPIAAAAKSLAQLNKAIDSALDAGQTPTICSTSATRSSTSSASTATCRSRPPPTAASRSSSAPSSSSTTRRSPGPPPCRRHSAPAGAGWARCRR